MKAIIFDFGGTIDTGGIHWSEKFYDAYRNVGVPISKAEFNRAYCLAEPEVYKFINREDSFYTTLQTQISLQFDYLRKGNELFNFLKKNVLLKQLTDLCYEDVKEHVKQVKDLLKDIKLHFKTGLVSNFYGNLNTVAGELNIAEYFDVIIDSAVAGYRKPDARLYKLLLSRMNTLPSETLMVGDSYERDIIPAKLLGCRTTWIKGRSFEEPYDISSADIVIKSLSELKDILQPNEILNE